MDWAFTSIEPVGADLYGLIVGNVLSAGEVADEELDAFDRAVFSGYVSGLEDVGWRGDPEAIRLMFLVTACMRFTTEIAVVARDMAHDASDRMWDSMRTQAGVVDREGVMRQMARINGFLAERAEEARRLIQRRAG